MATLAEAKLWIWIRRLLWLIIILAILYVIGFLFSTRFGAIVEALTPPVLPAAPAVLDADWRGDQNWSERQSTEFHHKTQGSRTLNIPLSWFLALEEPSDGLLGVLFSSKGKFSSGKYLSKFGFIPRKADDKYNPYGLPVGFTPTPYQTMVGLDDDKTAVGFTCAACHTGQLVYDGKRYIIDGGPAMIDLGQLTIAIGAALGQTGLSSRIPLFDGRYERFAKNVLKERYSDQTSEKLSQDLTSVLEALAKVPNWIDVTEGFSRLDALNRIGNQVFSIDPGRPENYVNINAPVNYPHIWTSSWFSWVQYDGSIMQPLVRNVGEAMGTSAHTVFSVPVDEGRYSNAIPIDNLHWIEEALAGETPPMQDRKFTGLWAPSWPEAFPPIDQSKVAEGAALYEKRCKGCHLPALTRAVETGGDPSSDFWRRWGPITWYENGEARSTEESLLLVKIIPQEHIGTDPGQGDVLSERKVNTAGSGDGTVVENTKGMAINVDVCVLENDYPDRQTPRKLVTVHVADDPLLAYPFALGAVVQMGIDRWFDSQYLDDAGRAAYEDDRPNCLQAGVGYKARPLNGVWATAPFLHNGSVPTLMDLLGPADERPARFLLGDPTFDPVRVGVTVSDVPETNDDYNEDGYFILKTSIPGNSNRGHEFSDQGGPGVIGPALSVSEREAIIEFLKTI